MCAGPAWRYKGDSQQSDRRFRQHFRADGSSQIGPGRSSPAWRHFLARARAHHLKHQRPEPLLRGISQQDRARSRRYRCQHPQYRILDIGYRISRTRRVLPFPAAEPSRACRTERSARKIPRCLTSAGEARLRRDVLPDRAAARVLFQSASVRIRDKARYVFDPEHAPTNARHSDAGSQYCAC